MSVDSLYCPECGYGLTAPLMNLDYLLCKRCNMSVHVDDAEKVISQTVMQSWLPFHRVKYLGVHRKFDDSAFLPTTPEAAQRITTFSGSFGVVPADSVVVMCLAHAGATGNPTTTKIVGRTPDDTRTKNNDNGYSRVQISFVKANAGEECSFELDWTGVIGATKPLAVAVHMFVLQGMSDSPYFDHKDGTDDIVGENAPFTTAQMTSVPAGAVALAIVAANANADADAISIPSEFISPFVALSVDRDVSDFMVDSVAFIESTPSGNLTFSGKYHDLVGTSLVGQASVQMFEVLR